MGLDRNISSIDYMIWYFKKKLYVTFKPTDFFLQLLNIHNNLLNISIYINFYKRLQKKGFILGNDFYKYFLNPLQSKGFLFTGPPGTGKTLLVKAIAGETNVPVLTHSGSLIYNPNLRGRGAKTVSKLFIRAKEIKPCIIFIDEIDSIGKKREHIYTYTDINSEYDLTSFFYDDNEKIPPKNPKVNIQRFDEFYDDNDLFWKEPEFTQTVKVNRAPVDVLQNVELNRLKKRERTNILVQLLIELDGLFFNKDILVIGATNRFEILDPALMRPGRFEKVLNFSLPSHTTRINLLKMYIKNSNIGNENISWEYFSKVTYGLCSAEIASIVFASELVAIQKSKKQKHTINTLERGVDIITSFPPDPSIFRIKNILIVLDNFTHYFFKKNNLYFLKKKKKYLKINIKNKFNSIQEVSSLMRNLYYNLGKTLILMLLNMTPIAYLNIWSRQKNYRLLLFPNKFNEFEEYGKVRMSRERVEKKLLAFFGGKVMELIYVYSSLNKFSFGVQFSFDSNFISITNYSEQSNFGVNDDLKRARILITLMVEKWYFFLETIAMQQFHPIFESLNLREYSKSKRSLFTNEAFAEEIEIELDMRNRLSKLEQKHSYQSWWMKKVATNLNFREKFNLPWSRIFLSDPEQSAQNIEWVAPDQFYHIDFRTPPDCMSWTYFYENGRFIVSNLILMKDFNNVFYILRYFSEFIDFISDYFLRYERIRDGNIKLKLKSFFRLLYNFEE